MTLEEVFPYRNPDGTPSFWHYQKDVIVKTLDAFSRGKRCVVIDAPVGSGKSVINYSILKLQGPAVYITAQKTLQDQIDNEDWPGVKSVKGRNAYLCNFALRKGIEHSCYITQEDIGAPTCAEIKKYNYEARDNSYRSLIDSILKTLEDTRENRSNRRARTSFANSKEVFSTISKLEQITPPGKDPKAFFIRSVACNINPVECPVKSARLMAKFSDIAVVNPDAFYALNKTMQLFEGRKHMVVDEAHRLDDAVLRMFRIKIPLGVFHDCFGINLNDIAALTSVEEFCQAFQKKLKTEIWPIIAAFKVMDSLEDCFSVHNMETSNRSRTTDKDANAAISKGASGFGNDQGFCLLSVFISAINNDNMVNMAGFGPEPKYNHFQDFYDLIRAKFVEACEKYKCQTEFDMDKYFIPKISHYIRGTDKFIGRFDTFDFRHDYAQKGSYDKIQMRIANHLAGIAEAIESEIYVIDGMVRSKFGDNRVFVKDLIHTTKEQACAGGEYWKYYKEFGYSSEDQEVVLDLIPLHIGCLLQAHIFRGIETVTLSSGTWPDPVRTLSEYGFKRHEIEVLRIKPIFPTKNRPIFVNTNPHWTDFSEKIDGRDVRFFYQTPEGAKKFNVELFKLISYIRQKHGIKTNVAVHASNYGIVKLIAEYYPILDESFLLHLPRLKEIQNRINGYTIFRQTKEQLLAMFINNPSGGLTLVSPSILEGMDFKEDICRAQIVLKAPIPNLGDKFVNYKFNGCPEINLKPDKLFLDRKVVIDLNQAYGRVVRGMSDWGETYVVDLALSKRLSKAFNVHIPDMQIDAPGSMKSFNMDYIKGGIACSKDGWGRFLFKWPI